MSEDKEGKYCTICGGSPPVKGSHIPIDGVETGIDHLDLLMTEVIRLQLQDDGQVRSELLKRAKLYNYIPKKKEEAYAEALLKEYQRRIAG